MAEADGEGLVEKNTPGEKMLTWYYHCNLYSCLFQFEHFTIEPGGS